MTVEELVGEEDLGVGSEVPDNPERIGLHIPAALKILYRAAPYRVAVSGGEPGRSS